MANWEPENIFSSPGRLCPKSARDDLGLTYGMAPAGQDAAEKLKEKLKVTRIFISGEIKGDANLYIREKLKVTRIFISENWPVSG